MANLFTFDLTPSEIISTYNPDQIRGQIKQNLFGSLPAFGGGMLGGQNMGGAALGMAAGMGLAGAMGKQPPQVQRLMNIQGIGQDVLASMNVGDSISPEEQRNFIGKFGTRLLKEGYTDEAFKVMAMARGSGGQLDISPDTQKAIRGVVIKGREKLEEKASTMVESMTRINELAAEARQGNRPARGTMVQQVARLAQGAGVITDRDAAAVTGDQDGFAFLLSAVMPNVDIDTQAALRGIDPLGPGFNTDNLLTVADKLLTSGRTSVSNRIEDLKEQASEARLSKQGQKALFAGQRNINALSDLKADFGDGGAGEMPEIDPALLEFMTPEERALFK